jgi:membrane protein
VDAAATSAFWGLLALFPFLFFVVSLVGLMFDPASIEAVVNLVTVFAPDAVRSEVHGYVAGVLVGPRGGDAILALVVSLWSASGGAISIGDALNRANGTVPDRRAYWKRRAEAVVTVIVCALFAMATTTVMTFGPALVERLFRALSLGAEAALVWGLLRWPLALSLAALAWAIAYRFLPDSGQRFRIFSPGAIVGIPLWIVASLCFSYYAAHYAHYSVAYGSLATAVILLLWAYLSIFFLLLGGELNAVLLQRDFERDGRGKTGSAKLSAP